MPSYLSSIHASSPTRRITSAASATGEASMKRIGRPDVQRRISPIDRVRARSAASPMSPVSMWARRTPSSGCVEGGRHGLLEQSLAQADAGLARHDPPEEARLLGSGSVRKRSAMSRTRSSAESAAAIDGEGFLATSRRPSGTRAHGRRAAPPRRRRSRCGAGMPHEARPDRRPMPPPGRHPAGPSPFPAWPWGRAAAVRRRRPSRRSDHGRPDRAGRRRAGRASRSCCGSHRPLPPRAARASNGADRRGHAAESRQACLDRLGARTDAGRMVFPWQRRDVPAELADRIPPGQVLTDKFPVLHFGRVPQLPRPDRLGLPRLGRGGAPLQPRMGGVPEPAGRRADAGRPLRDALVEARHALGGSCLQPHRRGGAADVTTRAS